MAAQLTTTYQVAVVDEPGLPALITRGRERATWRFLEFFRNPHRRDAYTRAAKAFLSWCECRSVTDIQAVKPVHVTGYIEELQKQRFAPTVKQHLACIRMLFDWLVTGQVVTSNPAHAVRGPRHSVSKGKTRVISSEEARQLLDSMDVSNLVRLRDRAFIAVMA